MKTSGAKGGRKLPSTGVRAARTKPGETLGGCEHPSVLPSAAALAIATITELTLERIKLRAALADLLARYDRREEHGWTYSDIRRLNEIRALVDR